MERLTAISKYGTTEYPWEVNTDNGCYDIDEKLLTKQIDRLAAYEDTGLEPEEIKELKDGFCSGCSVPMVSNELRHIQDILEAEKDGRLVVLPCKVGDDVYIKSARRDVVVNGTVDRIHVLANGKVQVRVRYHVSEAHYFLLDDFGKTIFLSRQEAEEALRKEAEHD